MTWEEIMRRVLPPVGSLSPHITSEFGSTNRPVGSTNPHRAVDFNYDVGPDGQRGINLMHPTVHSPVAGVVTKTGGKYGIVAIRDANGLSHEILHTDTRSVKEGDLVGAGTPIGTMGNTGANAQHVHYQLKDRAGNVVNPTEFWNNLDAEKNDPSQPAFLDQSRRAAEIFSGLDEKSRLNGTLSPDRPGQPFFNPFNQVAPPNPIADRYAKWASVPLPNAPAASNDPASFADRYGNWASSPAGVLGNINAPASRTPDQGRRSEIPDGMTPPATTAADDNAPARIPERQLVNLSSPASSDAPSLAPVPQPLLGIFSGQPMRDYPVRPSIFESPDPPSADDDNELVRRWKAWVGD